MIRVRKFSLAILLTVLMAIPTLAGETPTPGAKIPPPPPASSNGETPTPGMKTNEMMTEILIDIAGLVLRLL